MKAVGIIAEYNPFHNGHLYHINKVKEMFPNHIIIVVLGGHFMQRGETSIINKWDKTKIALAYGADIVVELPFPFATQAADFFAKGSIQILKELKIDKLVFGSESNDIEKLMELAKLQLNNKDYDEMVKKNLDEGINYPTALSKSLQALAQNTVNTPNDILGISYIREILNQKAKIEPITIKRTNDYHNADLDNEITSATSIRKALSDNKDVSKYVPDETNKCLYGNLFLIDNYFPYLKYQILNNIDYLSKFQTVDEGIENRIKKGIVESHSFDELISKVKTKRYTYNKIRRMFAHIICNFTKEEAKSFKDIRYLRLLGFTPDGQKYLNIIKKELNIPLITKFSSLKDEMLNLEFRTTCVYASILNEEEKQKLIEAEYKNYPIRFDNKKSD